jgi:hypothetical protein
VKLEGYHISDSLYLVCSIRGNCAYCGHDMFTLVLMCLDRILFEISILFLPLIFKFVIAD